MIREVRRGGGSVPARWAVPAVVVAVVVAGIALVLALDLRNTASVPHGLVVPTMQGSPSPTATTHHRHHRPGIHHPTPSWHPTTPASVPASGVVIPHRPIVSETPDRNEADDGTGGRRQTAGKGDE